MKVRHLTVQIALTLAVLVAGNLVVSRLAQNSVPRQTLRKGEQSDPANDLFLGNSLVAAGLDEAAFATAAPGRRPLNLGLGSSSPVEHYLIYRRQIKHQAAAVYYGFFDTQLTDIPDGKWDALVGNRAMAYYVDPAIAAQFLVADSSVRALAFRVVAQIPWLVERLTIWAKVELLRRSLGELGMPKKLTNQFGRAEDFGLLEEDVEQFTTRCRLLAADQAPLTAAVVAIIRQAQERGSPIYLVEMPMPEGHRKRYYQTPEWIAYQAHLKRLLEDAGGRYVPAADWIDDSGFADHLHLNQDGARRFSTRLAAVREQR